MHPIAAPVRAPSTPSRQAPDPEGLELLLDLMVDEPVETPGPPRLPSHRWATRVQELSSRASSWGEGPQGAWRAW